ncbi:MAG: LLM class flavin-dependent oxidoreductase [Deltaproteobacteria bacterium]|nr:LLM class flavin-dependent oxidoreductase [Deltaproteobacteria bacterium]
MKLGIEMFATDFAIRPDELARACEERGFESVWYPEHTHIPASRRTPFPGGTDLPKEYWHTHDLFVSMMAAAAVTKTIKIGSGICLAIERDPITMAKEVGEFVNFDPIWCYPKPVQKPHPPIVLGSNTAQGLERVAKYCDGWLPNARAFKQLPAMVSDLRNRTERAGRRPDEISISVLGVQGDETMLQQCRELGAERAIFFVPSAEREKVLPLLDQYAALIPKVA